MAISLFEHNETAYYAALSMMEKTGKAAIVHPTGTGKSFIGFKLCEDNPNKKICWLSPSEYIFKTQLENLSAVSDGYQPNNIDFYTYARLMNLTDSEIAEIQPDYIVLDEFHRAGAEEWGKGVQKLLKYYDNRPILGLSATNVRYLDNQRDMADELFGGNIASYMTLGEAIVRGILNAPKYVLSVYSCRKSLKKYEERVRRQKSKATRDAAEEYLEELRRSLDKAEGIDEIFRKHITDKNGKYIVFCSDYGHLCEMTEKVPEWFGEIDENPRIYKAYSEDPSTDEAFAAFKQDSSEHLKLLFCIDMLNEGVHVDDVNGVILLRPTVSPIIYKQQIGRALSASKKTNPVIFDIVLNIENLYSIGSIEDEMQIATAYYRSRGEGDKIAVENFRIYDEVRECKLLFNRLNDALSASWEYMYSIAKRYYETHGNLEVEKRYITEEGYSLGTWLNTQRLVYAGKARGILTDEQVEKLNAIGMRWESVKDIAWEKFYTAAKEYFTEYGNLLPAVTDKAYHGVKLAQWVAQLRSSRKSGIGSAYLTDERIKLLDEIGMVWDVPDYLFEKSFAALLEFYRENGNSDVPCYYVTADGLRLGTWVFNIRSRRKKIGQGAELTEEQIKRLDELGFSWDGRHKNTWDKAYLAACEYKKKNGDLKIPVAYVSKDGIKLGVWIRHQIDIGEKLSTEKKEKLLALGVNFEKTDSWEVRYALVKAYYEEHRNLDIPSKYKANGIWLSKWVNEQRQIYIGNRGKKRLTDDQISRLSAIGMVWDNSIEKRSLDAWEERYAEAKRYFDMHGDLIVPTNYVGADGKRLGTWIIAQRRYYEKGKLKKDQIDRLSSIGMIWAPDDAWENGYQHAAAYYGEKKDLLVPISYVCTDGFTLGVWISNQRNMCRNPRKYQQLTDEQKERLEKIGMVWSALDERWKAFYDLAAEYSKEHGNLQVGQKYKTADGYGLGGWVSSQRKLYAEGKLDIEKIQKLNAIGMDWMSPPARAWETHFEACKRYYEKYGNLTMPLYFTEPDGFQLGMWLWRVRTGKVKLRTSGENGNQIARLEAIGFVLPEKTYTETVASPVQQKTCGTGLAGGAMQ